MFYNYDYQVFVNDANTGAYATLPEAKFRAKKASMETGYAQVRNQRGRVLATFRDGRQTRK